MRNLFIFFIVLLFITLGYSANELRISCPTGSTVSATISDKSGKVWDPSANVFETAGTSGHTITTYAISLSQIGTAIGSNGNFRGDVDSDLPEGIYTCAYYVGTTQVFSKQLEWSGSGEKETTDIVQGAMTAQGYTTTLATNIGTTNTTAAGVNGFAAIKTDTATTLLDTHTNGVVVAAGSKTGYALTSEYDSAKTAITPTTVIDGTVTWDDMGEILTAFLTGKVTIVDNGANSTISFYKRDGTSIKYSIISLDSNGTRSATGTVN